MDSFDDEQVLYKDENIKIIDNGTTSAIVSQNMKIRPNLYLAKILNEKEKTIALQQRVIELMSEGLKQLDDEVCFQHGYENKETVEDYIKGYTEEAKKAYNNGG